MAMLKLPYRFAKQHHVIIAELDEENILYFTNETPANIIIEIQRNHDSHFALAQLSAEEFQQKLTSLYETDNAMTETLVATITDEVDVSSVMQSLPKTQDLLESQDDAPVIRLLNAIFSQAIKESASDIHIETYANKVVVRYRVDGLLREILTLPRALAAMVISRIKVMSKLDIAEKRIPQDGRISLRVGNHHVDVRVSTIPANHAERVVLRLLDQQNAHLNLASLGMPADIRKKIEHAIQHPHGILLVTGPTGSGKSTSLYAMLSALNETSRNILTVEDPIEYDLPGVGQMQVNLKVDMTFAKGLRAILRQDPDVVMVGEIRDLETADIAIQASLTGHLVFSTLHTNTAIGAVARLRDMGVEPFLLSSSLIGLLAQRLVRKLCPHCKQSYSPSEPELAMMKPYFDLSRKPMKLYRERGCEHCLQQGFKGRTGIYEYITINETLRQMIHECKSEHAMNEEARKHSHSLRQHGFQKALEGETTLAEILRVSLAS